MEAGVYLGVVEDVGEIARRIFVKLFLLVISSTKHSGKQVPLTMALRSE